MSTPTKKNALGAPITLDRIFLTPEQRMECKRLIDSGRIQEAREIIEKALESYSDETDFEQGLRV